MKQLFIFMKIHIFKDINEVEMAYENDEIGFHTRFAIPARAFTNCRFTDEQIDKYLVATYGKIIFNTIFPVAKENEDKVPFIKEAEAKNITDKTNDIFFLEKGTNIKEALKNIPCPHPFKKKFLSVVIAEVFKKFKLAETSKTLDKMKDLGFKYSTISGITVSVSDINVVDTKKAKLEIAENTVRKYDNLYRRGLLNEKERRKNVIKVWQNVKSELEEDIKKEVNKNYITNHIYMMSDSGARGNIANFVQLSGMRGLMAKPNGESMDIPIKASFREGLSMSDFFISSHGSRKGSTDTALKTAESGYLTRRLVDVSQEVTVTMNDCRTCKGMKVTELRKDDGGVIAKLEDRIRGRFTSKPIVHPETGEVILEANEYINDKVVDQVKKAGIKEVYIRTLLTCDCPNGVCVKCYGSDLSTGEVVEKGEVVGIIAAQSIGEPGTQLTMRTFHSGGVAGEEDITQGLPRIQELFEARPSKAQAIISEIEGVVESIKHEKDNRFEISIRNKVTDEVKKYLTNSGKTPTVQEGDFVNAGQPLTAGVIHPKELLRVSTTEEVEKYILKEVEKVYSSQSVDICDKHVEIIIKQMLQKVLIVSEGDTGLLPGSHVSKNEIVRIFADCNRKGLRKPIIKPILLGITRSSLKSDSYLSAASFQETTRVLTDAAIKGKVDPLIGLKENVIIGKLIPAGTGLNKYKNTKINTETEETSEDGAEVAESNLVG